MPPLKKKTSIKAGNLIQVQNFRRIFFIKIVLTHNEKDFLLWANPGLFFIHFPFSHQVESNSDRTDLSWPLYPLDHHNPYNKKLKLYGLVQSFKSKEIIKKLSDFINNNCKNCYHVQSCLSESQLVGCATRL